MTLTVNAKTFTADSFNTNSVGYTGPAHTLTLSDYMRLARQAAKKTTTSSGVSRTESKLTRTLTLTGALEPTRDGRLTCSVDIPVGAASADIDSMCNDMGAWISSAAFKTHVKGQLINF